MENKNDNGGFRYTYSAREQEEIKRIRAKYAPAEAQKESKMARVRRLDAAVTQKAQAVALIFGIVGALLLGFGMSLIMTELSAAWGWSAAVGLLVGLPIGIVGCGLVVLAYPAYGFALRRERQRVSAEILSLTEELIK